MKYKRIKKKDLMICLCCGNQIKNRQGIGRINRKRKTLYCKKCRNYVIHISDRTRRYIKIKYRKLLKELVKRKATRLKIIREFKRELR